MPKYRKKPTLVDAIPVFEILKFVKENNWAELPQWVVNGFDEGMLSFTTNAVYFGTKEGPNQGRATDNEWLIHGQFGEFSSCTRNVFEEELNMIIKFYIKDSDCFYDAVQSAVNEEVDKLNLESDEHEAMVELRIEKTWNKLSKWIEYQEYLNVEMDTEADIATVVPRK